MEYWGVGCGKWVSGECVGKWVEYGGVGCVKWVSGKKVVSGWSMRVGCVKWVSVLVSGWSMGGRVC